MSLKYSRVEIRHRRLFARNEFLKFRYYFFLKSLLVANQQKNKIKLLFFRRLRSALLRTNRYRNRCLLSDKGRSVFRYFKLSRMTFKNAAAYGSLTGVQKSSW